jgi:hypothetical protein
VNLAYILTYDIIYCMFVCTWDHNFNDDFLWLIYNVLFIVVELFFCCVHPLIYLAYNNCDHRSETRICVHVYIYIYIFSINLVSQVTLRSSGTDILYGCHLLRCLYNILYFLWLYDELFIILYNILKIADLDCCQIIILSIYVPSTHA